MSCTGRKVVKYVSWNHASPFFCHLHIGGIILCVAFWLPFKLHGKRINLTYRFICAASVRTIALSCVGFHSVTATEIGKAKKSVASCACIECQLKQKCWFCRQPESAWDQQSVMPTEGHMLPHQTQHLHDLGFRKGNKLALHLQFSGVSK